MWIAFLMRQWDSETGTEIQLCDLKCGQQILLEQPEPYLSMPFHMKGKKWVGIKFDSTTVSNVVFRLFDLAVHSDNTLGYTIVLDYAPTEPMLIYPDTPLPVQRTAVVSDDPDIPQKTPIINAPQNDGEHQTAVLCDDSSPRYAYDTPSQS